jgi:hypothetical protein
MENNIDINALILWHQAHVDIYSKFKQDLESQLDAPYWKNILELNGEEAEPLKSVLFNIAAISSYERPDFDSLYTKAVESNDVSAYCLCYYLYQDQGYSRLAEAIKRKAEEPGLQEILGILDDYKKFSNYNRHRELSEISKKEVNLLTLRRWHYDHQEEYGKFIALYEKAYEGDMTFFQNNMFTIMDLFSLSGIKGIMRVIASFVPGNKYYKQRLLSEDGEQVPEKLSRIIDSSLNDEKVRKKILKQNPYAFSLFYWITFDDGFLHAADLLSKMMLGNDRPGWQRSLGKQSVRSLVRASMEKAHYTKTSWAEMEKRMEKGEAKEVISAAIHEAQGRRGQSKQYMILEEMLSHDNMNKLTDEIHNIVSEWKEENDSDTILAYLFTALRECNLLFQPCEYRTFHAAMREKFPDADIKKGYDWAEALYYAINENLSHGGNLDISERQIKKAPEIINRIKTRLLIKTNPNII